MRGLSFVLALATSPLAFGADVIRGSQLYGVHCASCHGVNGIAVLPNAPSFARGERLMQPDPVLLVSVRTGRGPMPGFFGILNDRDILDVIAYLRTLR